VTTVALPMRVHSQPRAIALREWAPWAVDLTLDEASRLARQAGDILDVDIDRRGAIVVRPQSYVGRFRTEDFDIRIDPKVPVESVLAMLGDAFDLVDFMPRVLVGEHHSIEDLIVRAFVAEVEALLRLGLHRVYTESEEALSSVRGRVLVRATTDLFLRGVPRVACRFEEFTTNNVENQVVAAALRAVSMNGALQPQHRLGARKLAGDFVGVDALQQLDLDGVQRLGLDVRTRHYRRALGLAEMILRAMGFHERHGARRSSGFLIDMNRLFETVLTKRLTQALSPIGFDVQRQVHTTLDLDGEVQVRPDIVVRDRSGRSAIVDAKYKNAATPSQADMYQMIAYCRAMGVTEAVLVDVAGGPERRYLIRDGVITVHTMHIDLSSMATLATSVRNVAERIAVLVSPI
jgi:5-methylcytosine-specific restriction enzyme subunit McrC